VYVTLAPKSGLSHLAMMTGQSINPWLALVVAGLLEVGWASGLKYVGPQRPGISAAVLAALAASMWLLWVASQKLPIGTAYAIWTGIGAVGAASVGMLIYNEPATMVRILCILLIVGGIVGLKLFSGAQ